MKAAMTTMAILGLVATANGWTAEKPAAWSGMGEAYEPGGAVISKYSKSMTVETLPNGDILNQGTITKANGDVSDFFQKIHPGSGGFAIESEDGQGGGVCLGESFCQGRILAADGLEIVFTVVKDSPTEKRNLVTLLKAGKVTRFYSEKLVRKE